MNLNRWNISRHLVFWMAYVIYFYLVNLLGNSNLSISTVIYSLPFFVWIYYGISYALNVYLFNKKYLLASLNILIVYGTTLFCMYGFTYGWKSELGLYREYMTSSPDFDPSKFFQNYLKLIGNFSIFALIAYQVRLKLDSVHKASAERDRSKRYEYRSLSQQVSPHLLANVFLSLEQQLRDVRPELRQQILELYGLMEYYMESNLPEAPYLVLLEEEIKATRKFIELQGSLASRQTNIRWEISGNTLGAKIPSTGLLTLVSNVFKHGDPYDLNEPVHILISVQRDCYLISVWNKIYLNRATDKNHGVGLKNLKKRMDYIFGEKSSLKEIINNGWFEVQLSVIF